MPSPWKLWTIILFWLATSVWLFERDVWPRLRTGVPPPYTIDLADEAVKTAPKISWLIYRGTQKIGTLYTWVSYQPKDDTFELRSEIPPRLSDTPPGEKKKATERGMKLSSIGPCTIYLSKARSMYRVTREGSLRALENSGQIVVALSGLAPDLPVEIAVQGEVRDRVFRSKGTITWSGNQEALELPEVEVAQQGSVLNPLHPVNRISGLRFGQHWQMPLVDPLRDSLFSLLQKNPVARIILEKMPQSQVLRAEVESKGQFLSWDGAWVPCFVINFESDDGLSAQTWVRQADGLVLRQEAIAWGDKLVLEREPR